MIHNSESGELSSEAIENYRNFQIPIKINDGRTDAHDLSSVSSRGEVAVAGNVTEGSFRNVPVVEVVADALKMEEIRVRERPVAGNVTDALVRGVGFNKFPVASNVTDALARGVGYEKMLVAGNVTDAFMRGGGAGDQQENSYQEIPTGRSTSARIEESRTQSQQENSYQETLAGENFPVTTNTTEVLECDGGLRDFVNLECSTSAHVEKNRAGNQQENSYQEIPSGKSRDEITQTQLKELKSMTNNQFSLDSAFDDSEDEIENEIIRVKIHMPPETESCITNTIESCVGNTTESCVGNTTESCMTNTIESCVGRVTRSLVDKSQETLSCVGNAAWSCVDNTTPPLVNNPTQPLADTLLITSVEYSRDQLLMRKDNVAHFMYVDCEISTPVCQQLVDLEMINIEKLKKEPIGIGAVVQTNLSNGKIIYSLFIKEKSNKVATAAIIVQCLESLRTAMIEEKVNSVSISKFGDGLEKNHWLTIEITLRVRWKTAIPKLIICTGDVVIPPPNDRLGIIHETHLHDFSVRLVKARTMGSSFKRWGRLL